MGFLFLFPPPVNGRHSRAYLHALFKSDTAAMHHITIHNISYQVLTNKTHTHTHTGVFFFLIAFFISDMKLYASSCCVNWLYFPLFCHSLLRFLTTIRNAFEKHLLQCCELWRRFFFFPPKKKISISHSTEVLPFIIVILIITGSWNDDSSRYVVVTVVVISVTYRSSKFIPPPK